MRWFRHCLIAVGPIVAAGLAASASAQDADHGLHVYAACAACHAKDHTNRLGPGLEGIVGRSAGSIPGFHYSSAMKSAGIVWDDKTLDAYLAAPQKVVPGNRMPYAGMANAQDRADIVAYLKTLK